LDRYGNILVHNVMTFTIPWEMNVKHLTTTRIVYPSCMMAEHCAV